MLLTKLIDEFEVFSDNCLYEIVCVSQNKDNEVIVSHLVPMGKETPCRYYVSNHHLEQVKLVRKAPK